jgi:hypothetical protein
MDALVAPFFVGVHDRFGVGPCAVRVPLRFELGADIPVVVDLAVEGYPDRFRFVRHRLMAAGQVDDAQTTVGEDRMIISPQPAAIGTPVRKFIAHP